MDDRFYVRCLLRLADLWSLVRSVVAASLAFGCYRGWVPAAAAAVVVASATAQQTVSVSSFSAYDTTAPANVHAVRTGYVPVQFYASESLCLIRAEYVGALIPDDTTVRIYTPNQGAYYDDGQLLNVSNSRISAPASLFRGCGGGTGTMQVDGIVNMFWQKLRVFPHLDGVWRFTPQSLPEDGDFVPLDMFSANGLVPPFPFTYANVDGWATWTLSDYSPGGGSQIPMSGVAGDEFTLLYQQVAISPDGRIMELRHFANSRWVPQGGFNRFFRGTGTPQVVTRYELRDGLPWEAGMLEIDLSTIEALLGNLRTFFVEDEAPDPNDLPEPATVVGDTMSFAYTQGGSARAWFANLIDVLAGADDPLTRDFTVDWQYLELVSLNTMSADGRVQAELTAPITAGGEPPSLDSNVEGPWWWYKAVHYFAQVLSVCAVFLCMLRDVMQTWRVGV
jgi:hypothetical protein